MQDEGRDGIVAMIGAACAQFPGHGFTLHGTPDRLASHLRFSWTLAPQVGSPMGGGTDVVCSMPWAEVVRFLDEGLT
jgi:hypothetical protein